MSTPLVGKQHKDTIEKLYEHFSQLTDKHSPQTPPITILEGVSGVGKSRIIRELYSMIRTYRNDEYWPPFVLKPDQEYSPLSVRKQLGPPLQGFVWKAGALPTFGWWEFNGEKMSTGVTMSMDKQVEDVVTVHTQPIVMATMKNAGFFRRMKKGPMQAVKDLRDLSRDQLTDRLWELITESTDGIVPVPGLKLALKWTQGGIRAAQQSRKERADLNRDIAQDEELAEKRSAMALLLADTILGMAQPDIPGIIVIEDMHLMGESFISFLNEIIRQQNGALMVVGTAWPDSEIKGRSAENTAAYRNWRDEAKQNADVQLLAIEAPSQSERMEIVRTWAPDISDDNARALTERIQNPLALELILTSRATKNALRKNTGDFPVGYIAKIPQALEEIYHERLQELDEEVRKSLAAVAGAIPDSSAQQTWPFIREHIARSLERGRNTILVEDGFGGALSATIRSLEIDEPSQTWLVPSGIADTFREALMAEVATRHLDDDLGLLEDIRTEIHWHLGDWLNQRTNDHFDLPRDDEARIVSNWYLELNTAADIDKTAAPNALLSAASLLASDKASADDYPEAVRILRNALDEIPNHMAGTYTTLSSEYLGWCRRAENDKSSGLKAAIDAVDTLSQRARISLDSTHPSHVDWLFEKGIHYEELEQVDEAINALEQAFEMLPHTTEPTSLEPAEVEQHRIDLYESAGRIDDALQILIRLVNEARAARFPNSGYANAMTEWLKQLLARHDRGIPEDYFDETDEQVKARNQTQDTHVQAEWAEIRDQVHQGCIVEATSAMSRLYELFETEDRERDFGMLDNEVKILTINLIGDSRASIAAEFLSAWRTLRPYSVTNCYEWLLAWALREADQIPEAIQAHKRGLDHWIRIPGANATDKAVYIHRIGLAQLEGDIDGIISLGHDMFEELAKATIIPDPEAASNAQANWIMEDQILQSYNSEPWADGWIKSRGNFLLRITKTLRNANIPLPPEDQIHVETWERIGKAASNEDPHELQRIHNDLDQHEQFGEMSNETNAAKLLAERLERLQEVRSARHE